MVRCRARIGVSVKQYLLFDLDGTLTDPKTGITTCVQYALREMGIDEPDLDKLEPFIGPPLKESFRQYYQMTEEQAEKAVEKYRERFQDTGIFENKVYEGIPEMLRTLQSKGMFLAVASSKPTVFVNRILEHFKIDKYFKVVVGSELDGTRVNKDEVVEEALRQLFAGREIEHDKVYMIGDRRFDVEGARAMHVESVGVAYGYGGIEELKEARADYIVRSVEELRKFLLRGTEETGRKKATPTQRIWMMLFPFLMFMLVRQIVMQMLGLMLNGMGQGFLSDWLVIRDEAGAVIGWTGNAATLMSALSFAAGAIAIWSTAKLFIGKTAEDMRLSHLKPEPVKNHIILFCVTVGAVMGMNLLLELTSVTNKSEVYKEIVKDQYSAAFLLGLVCYGVITPIAEEIMFRGVVYTCLRRMAHVRLAIPVSALLFGAYHMNAVQGVYAFVIGCLMAYGYEYFGRFYIPVAIHIVSNLLAYTLGSTSVINTGFISWPVCIFFLLAAAGGLYLLNREKRIL